MLVAIVGAYGLVRRRQRRLPLTRYQRWVLGFSAFVGAMLGAKLPFVMQLGWEGLASGVTWFADGKTILGGIFGGYLAVELGKWYAKISIPTGDSFALPVAVAVAMGRFGCFLVGCCYGVRTDAVWGVHFPSAGDPPEVLRHPTQLYEMVFHLLAAGILVLMDRRRWLVGQQLKAYLLAYLFYRFVTEWLRPEARILSVLTAYQIASCILAIVLLLLWWRDAHRRSVPSVNVNS
jgi:prolipoprotein diacylglyceryltransferase